MARILVTGSADLGGRALVEQVRRRVAADGHAVAAAGDALPWDAVALVLDGPPGAAEAPALAVAAQAHAAGKPVLLVATSAPGAWAALATQVHVAAGEADLCAALPAFYAAVRPFAGKLVRDLVPRLVQEAGHSIAVREAEPGERVLLLKRKVAQDAQQLEKADAATEKEWLADVLEAIEALIHERRYTRDDLRLVKQARLQRRGGFGRCLVVESAAEGGAPAAAPAAAPARAPATASATPAAQAGFAGLVEQARAAAQGEPARPPQPAQPPEPAPPPQVPEAETHPAAELPAKP